MINLYEAIGKKYQDKEVIYESYNEIKIKIPMRMLIIGASGSGKTLCLMNLVTKMNSWNKIYLLAKNPDQPLYRWFIDNVRKIEKKNNVSILTVLDKLSDCPTVEMFDKKNNNLVIVDDFVNDEKKLQAKVIDLYIRGRHNNVSVVYLSQSYFSIPSNIRKNADYIMLKKVQTLRDLKSIVREYSLNVKVKELIEIYKKAISNIENFFLIDLYTNDDNLKYRINFTGIGDQIPKEV
jgi:hypothetical protein